jgi:protein-L-isoaspartate O-methyltransferase
VLRTPSGDAALAAATELTDRDPLAAAAALRRQGFDPGLAAAALTQVALRRKAVAKFGADAARMFFTRAGLEQATRRAVADRRATRLAAAGVRTLADIGCGLGADALAAARAGIEVYALEADAETAALAAANAEVLGLASLVTVTCADATAAEVARFDAVFCDPARRGPGGRRVFDPAAFSPPWDFVAGLASRVPRTVLKLAPGIGHELLPPGAEGEWVSVDGDLVEAAFWCGPLASAPRRATVLRGSAVDQLTGSGTERASVGPVGAFLWDPDPAVVRSHLVAGFAASVGGRLADDSIAYVHADAHVPSPFGRCIAVTDVLPFSLKRLRALLRERGVGRVEILKRGSAVEPSALRRDLRLAGPHGVSLVLTRVAGAPTVLLGNPVA